MKMRSLYSLLLATSLWSCSDVPETTGPLPTAAQLAWHEKEFYLFIHFGPNTFTDKEWGEGTEDPSVFHPTELDCAQWARLAKKAGAKGIILTAKHHDGFALWPSNTSTHTVRESTWMGGKGDVVRALADACKQEGIEMGIYLSPWDRNHPAYGTPAYNDIYISAMKELITGYGPFFEFWWDGANGEGPNGKKQQYDFRRFEDSVRKWQPELVVFSDIGPDIRWCGNEKGFIGNTNWNLLDTAGFLRGLGAPPTDTLNQGNRYGKHWIPAEADVSIRPGWFYHASEDDKVKSPATLFDLYLRSVGNGGNLLLNIPPDKRGRFHEADSAALMGFAELRKQAFANNLLQDATLRADQKGKGELSALLDPAQQGWRAEKQETILDISLPQAKELNAVVLQEMIAYGQKVIRFSIEVAVGDGYKEVYNGTTIGRKKIAVFDPVRTQELRVRIQEAKASVHLRSVAAYRLPAM